MRTVIVVLCGLSLAGCVSPQQQAQRAAAVEQIDDSQCQKMGYHPGTELYLKCRTVTVQLRMQAAQGQPMQTQDVGQRMQNAGAALSAAGAPPAMPPMQQPALHHHAEHLRLAAIRLKHQLLLRLEETK